MTRIKITVNEIALFVTNNGTSTQGIFPKTMYLIIAYISETIKVANIFRFIFFDKFINYFSLQNRYLNYKKKYYESQLEK